MRLYFKNRNSPKAYKVVITALNDSHLGFIGEITNPTMKIGNGVVQFYLAPIASQGTWTIDEDYHFKDGKLTLMAFKNLTHTSYNSHVTYSDFTKNIQLALELTEFHGFEIIGIVVKEITSLSDASWMYDAENKKILYYNSNTSGSLTLNQVASGINTSLISQNTTTKSKAELLIKEVIKDLFRTQPKGLLKASEFNSTFITNAVLTVLGTKIYSDTDVNKYTTSSLNFSQGLIDRIPDVAWNTEGNATVVSGGEAFSHTALQTTGALGDALKTSNKLITGGSKPFTVSFDFLIKEDQIKANTWPYLSLFSKSTNIAYGDQFLYVRGDLGYKLCFQRSTGVGGNVIQEVVGNRRIEYNTKYTVKITYDGNMFKCFLNDVLDFKFGTTVGWFADSDQPYRLLDNLVPSYPAIGTRAFTNGYIDNVQVDDGISRDHTIVNDPYLDSLVSKLSFQGQADKTVFVDEAKATSTWTGYGDAKLVVEDTLSNYSYLNLNGMSSYLLLNNADYFAFTGAKFSIRMSFKTSVTSREQALFDRYESGVTGSYNISLSQQGKILFYYLPSGSYQIFSSNISNLNDGVKHTIDVIKEGNSLLFYIDNVLDSMHDVTGVRFDYKNPKTAIGAQVQTRNDSYDFNGQIYEFFAYDGVSVYPNIVVKNLNTIELNFNKNQIQDVVGNSTWTNTGVTFDRVNSVKGYSAYFSNSAYTQSSLTQIDFSNHTFELDINPSNVPTHSIVFSVNGHYLYVYIRPTSLAVELYNAGVWLNGYGHSCIFTQNQYNNIKLIFKNKFIYFFVNNILIGVSPNDLSAYDVNQSIILGRPLSGSYPFKGYIDNFKSIKNHQEEVVIDLPAVHLPLETGFNNTGYTPVSISSVGAPTYEEIEGKKCIRFSPNNYLRVASNSIFNLGTNSKFYIEFDFYKTSGNYGVMLSDNNGWTDGTSILSIEDEHVYLYYRKNSVNISLISTNKYEFNTWQNVKIYRDEFGTTTVELNGIKTTTTSVLDLNFARNNSYTSIGTYGSVANENAFNGYLSNFKMFVGASEPAKDYNPRQVLDLDFKPTYKSYLFKDNYNNCVINPINLNFRHYEDDQYCLKLNGVDQYLQLGKNNLFNFDLDDFVLKIKFKVSDFTRTWQRLISDNEATGGSKNYIMVTGDDYSITEQRHKIFFGMDDTNKQYLFSTNTIEANVIYELKIVRNKNQISMYINDALEGSFTTTYPFNLNSNNNTFIGAANRTDVVQSSQDKQILKGVIYSIRVLRNTSDLSLLNDILPEPESPNTGVDTGIPPLEKGVLNFWQLRQEVDPHNLVLEFNQLRLE